MTAQTIHQGQWSVIRQILSQTVFQFVGVGVLAILTCAGVSAETRSAPATAKGIFAARGASESRFFQRLQQQRTRAEAYMLNNVSRPECLPGCVVASPSKSNPNYFFHWTRDSALTMLTVLDLFDRSTDPREQTQYLQILKDYVLFSRKTQVTPGPVGGPGEVRFNVDGTADYSSWARPQNDGPALRTIALAKLAKILVGRGESDFVRIHMYAPQMPAYTVMKTDLEYISHRWQEPSYDAWEELHGQHFFHRLMQRRALLDGAQIAELMEDLGAAGFYRFQAAAIEPEINQHYNENKGYIVATLFPSGGIQYKSLHLDSVVILGALAADRGDGFYSMTDARLQATALELIKVFRAMYPINQNSEGIAIGRYPEDRYDGIHSDGFGNPWFLITQGFSEYFYRMAKKYQTDGRIEINLVNLKFFEWLGLTQASPRTIEETSPEFAEMLQKIVAKGDAFMAKTLRHMNQTDGSMSEQFSRETGVMQGANDLTWSYASFLGAYLHRPE